MYRIGAQNAFSDSYTLKVLDLDSGPRFFISDVKQRDALIDNG